MSSSSVSRNLPRATPPPDQITSFYKLVDKHIIAARLCRHARNAELFSQASQVAEALFGDDSLVVANLRCSERSSLCNLVGTANGAEQATLLRCARAVLVSVINLLQRRLADNTLLPGTIREEELEYDVHVQAAITKAMNKPVPSPAELRIVAPIMGYSILLNALFGSLNLLHAAHWPTVQRRMLESFVLQGLDVIPRTAGVPSNTVSEHDLVAILEKLNPHS